MSDFSSARRGPIQSLRKLWQYRDLVARMAARNLKVKYKRSIFGFIWTLLNPIMTVTVLVGVFSYVVRVEIEAYWAFLISGYFVWTFFGQTMGSATYVLREYAQLGRAVAFPKEAPILAAAISRLVEFSIEMVLVLACVAVFHHGHLPSVYLWIPPLVLLQVMIALGVALPVATLSAFFHDVEHAVPIVLTALFYLSPVFYSVDLVPEVLRPVYMLSPLAGLLTLFQSVIHLGQDPSSGLLLQVSGSAIALLVVGYVVFNRYEPLVAEVV